MSAEPLRVIEGGRAPLKENVAEKRNTPPAWSLLPVFKPLMPPVPSIQLSGPVVPMPPAPLRNEA